MINPSEKVLRALVLFQAEHPEEYRSIEEWFLVSAEEKNRTLREAEAAHLLHRAQGAVGEHLQISKILANAQSMAVEMARKKAGIRPIP